MELVKSFSDGENAYDVISFRNVHDRSDLVANTVLIGDMTFIPAALIAEFYNSQEHVLYCCGIVLYGKTSVTVCIDLS